MTLAETRAALAEVKVLVRQHKQHCPRCAAKARRERVPPCKIAAELADERAALAAQVKTWNDPGPGDVPLLD